MKFVAHAEKEGATATSKSLSHKNPGGKSKFAHSL